jgi:hypothetical protein
MPSARAAARSLSWVVLAIAASIAACRNNVPPPALPAPIGPELSRDAPKPRPIDPKKRKPVVTMREVPAREIRAAHEPADAGVTAEPLDAPPDATPTPPASDADISDVFDLPEVPDAEGIVTDPRTPLL